MVDFSDLRADLIALATRLLGSAPRPEQRAEAYELVLDAACEAVARRIAARYVSTSAARLARALTDPAGAPEDPIARAWSGGIEAIEAILGELAPRLTPGHAGPPASALRGHVLRVWQSNPRAE